MSERFAPTSEDFAPIEAGTSFLPLRLGSFPKRNSSTQSVDFADLAVVGLGNFPPVVDLEECPPVVRLRTPPADQIRIDFRLHAREELEDLVVLLQVG